MSKEYSIYWLINPFVGLVAGIITGCAMEASGIPPETDCNMQFYIPSMIGGLEYALGKYVRKTNEKKDIIYSSTCGVGTFYIGNIAGRNLAKIIGL